MTRKFKNITKIEDQKLYEKVLAYTNGLINEATSKGMLTTQGAENEYTREIGRIGRLCADYETNYITFKSLQFKSPLLSSIENELEKRSLKQRQAAQLLDIKESTFSQIITGKRPISMQMAKKLYRVFNIDPKLILEYS